MLPDLPYAVLNKVPFTKLDGPGGANLYLVNTEQEWAAFFEMLMSRKIVACDTETTGFRYFAGDKIVGMSFGWGEENFYIPVRHEDSVLGGKQPPQLCMDDLKEDLQEFFSRKDVFTLYHNFKFDSLFYNADGINIETPFHDTRILWQLYDENAPGALKMIASGWVDEMGRKHKGLVGPEANEFERELSTWRGSEAKARRKAFREFIIQEAEQRAHELEHQDKNKNELKQWLKDTIYKDHPDAEVTKEDVHYGFVPIELMVRYAATDTYLTYQVYDHVMKNLPMDPKLQSLYVNELKLSKVLQAAEEAGVKVDRPYLIQLREELDKEEEEVLRSVHETLGDINLNSNDQLAKALTEAGVPLTKTTATGKLAVDQKVLNKLSKDYSVISKILKLRQIGKIKNTYVLGILDMLTEDDILHCSFNQNVSTGRMCIAEGSLVQMPCDRSTYPKGKPIEEVKVGDYVYTYDEEGNLHLRKVLWAGCRGKKKTVKLEWKGQGNKHKGSLQLTPDHRVRLFSGEWIEAQNLKPGDRIMSLSSGLRGSKKDQYTYLYGRYSSSIREHVFIANQLGLHGEVVHHIDENKLNNSTNNLCVSSFSEHSQEHISKVDPKVLKDRSRFLHTPEARRKRAAAIKHGPDNLCWKTVSRQTLLRWAAKGGGQIRKVMQLSGMDYETLIRKYSLADIDLASVKLRYNKEGEYLSKRRVREASELVQPYNYTFLKVGYYKFKKLLDFYGLEQNHVVLSVTDADEVFVYDLEVEEFNNFIASELCVHNSSKNPNLQNIPGADDRIRRAFISLGDDYVYVFADYSQVEVRLTAHYSEDPLLLDAYRRNQDVHTRTMCEMFGLDYDEVQVALNGDGSHPHYKEWKNLRRIAKCVHPSTIVRTPEGPRRLDSLPFSDQEDSFLPSSAVVQSEANKLVPVRNTYNGTMEELLHVITNRGVVTCTGRHLFSDNDGNLLRADELKPENSVVWVPNTPKWVDKIEPIVYKPFSQVPEVVFYPTKEMAYVGGLFAGDGSVSGDHSVSITHGPVGKVDSLGVPYERTQKSIMESCVAVGLEPVPRNRKVYLGSRSVLHFFGHLGLVDTKRSLDSKSQKSWLIPQWVWSNKEFLSSYLGGLFDTDGTVSKRGYLSVTTKSPWLAGHICEALNVLGIRFTCELSYNATYHRNYYRIRLGLYEGGYFAPYMKHTGKVSRLCLYMPEKWVERKNPQVLTVESAGKHKCVDIEVDSKDHLYVSNGLVTHNTINFGIIYGVGAPGLSEQIPRPDHYKDLSDKQWIDVCQNYIDQYMHKYIGVKRFINRSGREIRKNARAVNHFGRVRRLPHAKADKIKGPEFRWMISRAERQGTNFLVQSTAADVFKIAAVRVHDILGGTNSYIVNFVHDEIQMYMHKDELYLLNKIKNAMEDFNFRVPIVADFAYSKTNWADKKELK